jgi:hypothetical protein
MNVMVNKEVWEVSYFEDYVSLDGYYKAIRVSDKKKLFVKEGDIGRHLSENEKFRILIQRISNMLDSENKVDELAIDIPSKEVDKLDIIIGLLQEISSKLGE